MTGTQDEFAANLDYWEQAAATHGTTEHDLHYHLDEVVAGGSLMTRLEERAVAAATGADAATRSPAYAVATSSICRPPRG